MDIVIIHHHLFPGGVTRIIESQATALAQYKPDVHVRIVVGTVPDNYQPPVRGIEIIELPALNYLEEGSLQTGQLKAHQQKLTNQLQSMIAPSSILHIHNPNLGKNPVFTYVVYELALKGYKIFNHAHDFAEDRPRNWQFLQQMLGHLGASHTADVMYPDLNNFKFGVLNAFDYQRLKDRMSISEDRLYWLPNPVSFQQQKDPSRKESMRNKMAEALKLDRSKLIITYPVRVIERKNIGEFILLAALFPGKASWLVTQPPKNPKEIVRYEQWKQFCTDHNIPVKFEVGLQVHFEELIIASDTCFTTSTREGFGMAYLEPWLFNTPVKGRNIPYITVDLKNKGIEFPYLYDRITIEGQDFKDMTFDEQTRYIVKVNMNSAFREHILVNNKHLISIFEAVSPALVKHNRQTIKTEFSLKKYANELYGIYEGFVG